MAATSCKAPRVAPCPALSRRRHQWEARALNPAQAHVCLRTPALHVRVGHSTACLALRPQHAALEQHQHGVTVYLTYARQLKHAERAPRSRRGAQASGASAETDGAAAAAAAAGRGPRRAGACQRRRARDGPQGELGPRGGGRGRALLRPRWAGSTLVTFCRSTVALPSPSPLAVWTASDMWAQSCGRPAATQCARCIACVAPPHA